MTGGKLYKLTVNDYIVAVLILYFDFFLLILKGLGICLTHIHKYDWS